MSNMVKTEDFLKNEIIDLSAELALVDPTDTPLTTLLLTNPDAIVPAKDVSVMWREKTLNTTLGTLVHEGSESGESIVSRRSFRENYCQILEKVTEISGTAAALDTVNHTDYRFKDEITDRLIELKRDLEWYYLNGTKSAESGDTPRQMNGLLNLVNDDNVIDASSGLTESMLQDGMEKMWDHGYTGDVYAFVPADIKRHVINRMLTANEKSRVLVEQGSGQSLGITVNEYLTDFGKIHFVMSRHIDSKSMLLVDLAQVQIAELRGTFYEDIEEPDGKDAEKGHVVNESCIKLLSSYAAVKYINIPVNKE